MTKAQCRLCKSSDISRLPQVATGVFSRCKRCGFIQRDERGFLSSSEEKRRYLLHENSVNDEGYVAFLSRLLDPLSQFLRSDADVLDYGSGPEPVLKELLQLRGFDVHIYDPFFAPFVPEGQFDAVTATEVFEHFTEPDNEIKAITAHLKQDGFLGIETLRYSHKTDLSNWHYMRDPTHVGFFSDKTFQWIESRYGFERVYDDGERVLILQKK